MFKFSRKRKYATNTKNFAKKRYKKSTNKSPYRKTRWASFSKNARGNASNVQVGGYSTTMKKYKPKSKAYKIGKSLVAPTYFNTTFANRHNVGLNGQATYVAPMLQGYLATTPGSTINDMFNAFSKLSPSQSIYLDYAYIRMQICNVSNVIANLSIRDVVALQDVQTSNTEYNPLVAWQNLSGEISGGAVAFNNNAIGATPDQETSNWNKQFRTEKVKKVRLNPGQIHVHKYAVRLCKRVGYADFKTPDMANLKGITRYCMVTTYGSPIVSDAIDTNIAISGCSLAITGDYHAIAHFVDDTSKIVYKINNLVNPLQTFADPVIMNDDTGTIQPYGAA